MLQHIAMLVLLAGASAAALAAGANAAQMYKCTDSSGKTYYTQVPPPECLGRSSEMLSKQGRVVKQIAAATPDAAASKSEETVNQRGIKQQGR